jgi:hypothetical protein
MFNVTSTLGPISAILFPASLSPHPIFFCPWLFNAFPTSESSWLVGSWVEFRCFASRASFFIPGELHFDLLNKQLMVSVYASTGGTYGTD